MELFEVDRELQANGNGAVFSKCGKYRYELTRRLLVGAGDKCTFVMLNPSTADALVDDPTIRRCRGFAERLGARKLAVVNLFAHVATNPKELRDDVEDPFGPENEAFQLANLATSRWAVMAWGANGDFLNAASKFCRRLDGWMKNNAVEAKVLCLGLTKALHPRHPLYVPGDTVPHTFNPSTLFE